MGAKIRAEFFHPTGWLFYILIAHSGSYKVAGSNPAPATLNLPAFTASIQFLHTGTNVLHLNGYVDFVRYLGKFPVSDGILALKDHHVDGLGQSDLAARERRTCS